MRLPEARVPQEQSHRAASPLQHYSIKAFAFFGSVVRDGFRSDSDVDVLVTFAADAHRNLFDMARMQDKFERSLGRRVNLVSRRGVENSHSYIRRKAILSSAEVVYAA